jgi:hypothetical protein
MSSSEATHRSVPRWIILVGRGQEELYEHLTEAFRRDRKVEVIMDRRKDPKRSPAKVNERLSTRGVAVIRREP